MKVRSFVERTRIGKQAIVSFVIGKTIRCKVKNIH